MKKILAIALLLVLAVSAFAAPLGASKKTKVVRMVTECKGDINNDGHIDFFDIDPFVAAMSPGTNRYNWTADITNDGLVNQDDVDPFVALLGQAPNTCRQVPAEVVKVPVSNVRAR